MKETVRQKVCKTFDSLSTTAKSILSVRGFPKNKCTICIQDDANVKCN